MDDQAAPGAGAFELGRSRGASPDSWDGQCPFPPGGDAAARREWFRGFSQGRLRRAAGPGTGAGR